MALFGSIAANADFSQTTGTATNDNASAGNIGEWINAAVGLGSGPSLTTATPANVTSVSLTAGDWDVRGQVVLEYTSATQSGDGIGSLSGVSATLVGDATDGYSPVRLTTTTCKVTIPISTKRVSRNGTGSTFLVAQATFTAGTAKASGFMEARRAR